MHTIDTLFSRRDNSYLAQLSQDPQQDRHSPNRKSREVHSGHYVRVTPEPLHAPRLVTVSQDMLARLGIEKEVAQEERFRRMFSGEVQVVAGVEGQCWATPYALSIYGQELYDNCPFGSGNGYGDGRAISVGEFIGEGGKRWEL